VLPKDQEERVKLRELAGDQNTSLLFDDTEGVLHVGSLRGSEVSIERYHGACDSCGSKQDGLVVLLIAKILAMCNQCWPQVSIIINRTFEEEVK
tara:strand:+ start:2312 stop:2593 length:282 start_codon:yes stop_codon:yes gene_type:complete